MRTRGRCRKSGGDTPTGPSRTGCVWPDSGVLESVKALSQHWAKRNREKAEFQAKHSPEEIALIRTSIAKRVENLSKAPPTPCAHEGCRKRGIYLSEVRVGNRTKWDSPRRFCSEHRLEAVGK